jgi:hypothetical protein
MFDTAFKWSLKTVPLGTSVKMEQADRLLQAA